MVSLFLLLLSLEISASLHVAAPFKGEAYSVRGIYLLPFQCLALRILPNEWWKMEIKWHIFWKMTH